MLTYADVQYAGVWCRCGRVTLTHWLLMIGRDTAERISAGAHRRCFMPCPALPSRMLPYAAVCCRMLPYAERERTGVAKCHSPPVLEKAPRLSFVLRPPHDFLKKVHHMNLVNMNLVNQELRITFSAFFLRPVLYPRVIRVPFIYSPQTLS